MADASIFGPGTVVKGEINGEDRVFVRGKVVGTIDIDSAAVVGQALLLKPRCRPRKLKYLGPLRATSLVFKVGSPPGGR